MKSLDCQYFNSAVHVIITQEALLNPSVYSIKLIQISNLEKTCTIVISNYKI